MPPRPVGRLRSALCRRRPRRLLVAIPGGEYGGAERYAVRIAAAAVKDGWEVGAAVRPYDATAPLRDDLHRAGVRVLRMVRGERVRELAGFVAMIAAYRPDVVHLTLPGPLAAARLRAACGLLGTPTVLVHAAAPEASDPEIRHAWFYRLLRRRRQHWVAVSAHGGAMLKRGFGLGASDEVSVIYNAPQALSFAGHDGAGLHTEHQGTRRMQARRALGIADDAPVIVTAGRLSLEKAHDILVSATEHLARDWPEVRVLIAGEGAARETLQHQIDAARLGDRVQLLGQVKDVGELLCAADVFAFPSRREGTPAAVLEAMAHGVPVVVARFGGAEEIVDADESGLLVEREDPAALAQAIAALLRDPGRAGALAERARQRAARFSEPVMLGSTLALLGAVADRELPARAAVRPTPGG